MLSLRPEYVGCRYVVVEPGRKLAVLTRMLRQDLERLGDDSVPARAMIFANNAQVCCGGLGGYAAAPTCGSS